jgi:flagellar biosynthesis chaperone FliJ
MTEEGVPDDLDVELQWPNVEAPAVSQREPSQYLPQPAGTAAPVPERTGGRAWPAEEFARRMEMLARAVRRMDPSRQIGALGNRIDQLADNIEDERKAEAKRAGDRAKKTGTQLASLAKRVDALAKTVDTLPAGAAVAELVGKVDAFSTTVEVLCEHLGSVADGYDQLRRQLELGFEPLREVTHEVRRLSELVVGRGGTRSDRQSELRSQIEQLAEDIRELRRTVPVRKESADSDVVDAVTAAVMDALSAEDAPADAKPARRRRRAKPASSATT